MGPTPSSFLKLQGLTLEIMPVVTVTWQGPWYWLNVRGLIHTCSKIYLTGDLEVTCMRFVYFMPVTIVTWQRTSTLTMCEFIVYASSKTWQVTLILTIHELYISCQILDKGPWPWLCISGTFYACINGHSTVDHPQFLLDVRYDISNRTLFYTRHATAGDDKGIKCVLKGGNRREG